MLLSKILRHLSDIPVEMLAISFVNLVNFVQLIAVATSFTEL